MNKISVIIAAGNNQNTIRKSLESVVWVDDIVIVLSENSTDNTEKIAREYTKKVYKTKNHLGYQRNFGINKTRSNWILILDSDEVVSSELAKEIQIKIKKFKVKGYFIPFHNYFYKMLLRYGNQNYQKLRLFQKKFGAVEDLKTHPEICVTGRTANLSQHIDHYSFRSFLQTLNKFTYYAQEDTARFLNKEQFHIKKITLYPVHMFYVLFIKERGYKDGIYGFLLAVCFAYYEFMRYFLLATATFKNKKKA